MSLRFKGWGKSWKNAWGDVLITPQGTRVFNGQFWVLKPMKVYTPTGWQIKPIKRWDGNSWK